MRTCARSVRLVFPSSATKTTSPPLPPSPPDGPPNGTNFSRRNAIEPFPPRPATMSSSAVSTNFTGTRYHRAVAVSKVHHLDLCSMCPFIVGPMAVHALLVETNDRLVLVDTGIGLDDVRSPGRR